MSPKAQKMGDKLEEETQSSERGSTSKESETDEQPRGSGTVTKNVEVVMTKTGVITTAVKVPVTLDKHGLNYPVWAMAFPSACELKGCQEAIERMMPDTIENSAALLMLIGSVP